MQLQTIEVSMYHNGIASSYKDGYFGSFGGSFVPEVLNKRLTDVKAEFFNAIQDSTFTKELDSLYASYIGRPSPLYYAKNLSNKVGAHIYLKREDLNHTGAHKINNAVGQALLAKRMGMKKIVAETGAGQHGVACATVAALFGLECTVFMGELDAERQSLNVLRMQRLGTKVCTTDFGSRTLKEAVDAALNFYIENPDTFYMLGSAVGPDPYPMIVRYFQSIIGREAREQILSIEGKLPDTLFACVGGGSNAIGLYSSFLDDMSVEIFGAEGGGKNLETMETAATLNLGQPMVFQGSYSYCLSNEKGEALEAYSVSAGLDYPGIGPEHAHLKESKRVKYYPIMDDEAIQAFKDLSCLEGIVPAIESAHAIALAQKLLKNSGKIAIVNLSGRGDKDGDRF